MNPTRSAPPARRFVAVAAFAAGLAAAPALAQQPAPRPTPQEGAAAAGPTYGVNLMDRQGNRIGALTLSQYPRGVFIHGQFDNAPPGWHGFHIHQTGACTPDFQAAGGHFNPTGTGHGLDDRQGHAGDLPNIYVHPDGTARFQIWTDAVSLTGGPNTLFDQDGSAFVLHALPDDYVTDPAGNSGDRIACGVLEQRS